MSKISIYEVAPVPKLADKLIGTSVGGVIEDITYNFTLQELLTLFIPNIPQNTLQGVLDYGNTATQNINLTGTINTTTLNVGATANILNSYLTGETHITGGLYDRLNSVGTAGQVLRSTGSKVEWYTVPTVIPNLQQVLTSGNTADVDIILNADIQALNINTNTESVFDELILDGSLRDYNGLIGTSGQVLSSTGTQVEWIDLPVYTATSPLSIDNITKVISIQKADSSHNGYLSSVDWINFDGKQNAISLTTTGSSGAATFVSNVLNIPNYTLSGLGGVPSSRTLTINGVTYDLSANRSWTIAAGVSSVSANAPLSSTGGGTPIISITQADTSTDGYLSSTDWDTFNNKQDEITLTTTGTSGPATLVGSTLNIPDYGGGLTGYVPYTGATGPVNLGAYNLTVNSVIVGRGTSTQPTNIAIGNSSTMGIYTATGTSNTAVGGNALAFLTTGYENTAFGHGALTSITTGYYNVGIGNGAGALVQLGINNIFIGRNSGSNILNGSGNTIIGGWQGNNVTANNVVLSDGYGNLRYRYDGTNNNFYQNVNFASTLGNGTYTYTLPSATGTLALLGDLVAYVPTSRLLSINGVQYDLSADRSWSVGTVTSVAELTLGTTGTDLSSSVATGTTTPVITLNVPTASASNRGALSSADWTTFNNKVGGVTASSPISSSGGSTPNITIQQASGSQDGYLSSTDWSTFNNKQAAGNYITSLTGEASATGPGAASVTLDNSAVTGKVLTGVNITGGSISATDSILTAFGKVQNQINGLIGGSIYQGTWNASTNTPTLTSGVGTRGYYYIVNVAGTTNLDGITDWELGDWAIFDGTAWQQVDNTDAVVSVNGLVGVVSLTTDNIPEGAANLYFLESRARAALSFSAGSGAYSSSTGVITIPTNTSQLTNGANFITLGSLSGVYPIGYDSGTGAIGISQSGNLSDGYLSSTDWNTFNNKQNALTNPVTGTGTINFLSKFTGTSSIGDSIVYDNGSGVGINTSSPYSSSSFKLDVNGGLLIKNTSGTTAQLVLIDSDPSGGGNNGFVQLTAGGTSSSAYGALQTYYGTSIVGGALRLQPVGGSVLINSLLDSGLASLQVTGAIQQSSVTSSMIKANSNGVFSAAVAGTDYVTPSELSGYVPTTRTLTINGVTYDLSADRTWSITAGVSSVTATSPLFSSGGSTPDISIQVANTSQNGYLSSSDWNTFNGKISGSGTINFLPKFTGSGTIGNSVAYDGGNSIGINTTAPYDSTQFKLDVNGGLLVKNTSGTAAQLVLINANPASGGNEGFFIQSVGGNSSTTWAQIQTYYGTSIAAGALRLQPTAGQVLVGTTTTSAFMVDINGTLRANGQLTLGSTISNGTYTYTLPSATGTLALTSDLSGYVPTSRTLTINGVTYDLSANRSWTITAGISSVSGTAPISVSTVSGAATVSISQATTSTDGYLSSTDWNIFNNKVPPSRTLTINGTTYDLSANRSWTITPNINATTTQDYTATAGQTTFTVSAGYTVGQLAVYYNGSKLAISEFTATDGSTFTLATACQVNDIVEAVSSVTGGGIGGSGTTNYIPKFTTSGTIGNSTLQQVGSGWMQLGDSTVSTALFEINGNNLAQIGLYDGYSYNTIQTANASAFSIINQIGATTTTLMNYNYSTKALTFQTNGNNERLRITSAGLVGIGTSSPSANLHLSGYTSGLPASSGSAQRGAYRIANSSNIGFDFGTVAAGQAWIQVSDVNNYASNFSLLLNPNGGNVGIGTSSPSYTLDVNGTGRFTGALTIGNLDGENIKMQQSTSTGNNYIRFYSSGGTALGYIGSFYSGGTQLMLVDGSGTDLSLNGNANLLLRTGGTERMRITSTGNVGIGTTNFTSIGSTDKALRVQASSGTSYIQAISGDGGSSVSLYSGASSGDNPSLLFRNSLRFGTTTDNVTGGYSERMRITSGGQLLINTTAYNGTGQVEVNGSMYLGNNNGVYYFQSLTTSNIYGLYGYSNQIRFYNNTYGVVGYFNDTTGAYTANSDAELKKNIVDSGDALGIVSKIKVRSYDWKATDVHEPFGIVAQELYEIAPSYVSKPIDDDSKWGVSKSELVPMLIKAIQELETRLKTLENK